MGSFADKVKRKANAPWMLLDTGTLFTMLHAKENIPRTVHDFGYLNMIVDMAKADLFRVGMSDMNVAEFLDIGAPLLKEDIFIMAPNGQALGIKDNIKKLIPTNYDKRMERLEFLKAMHNTGNFRIFDTKVAKQYLEHASKTDDTRFKNKISKNIDTLKQDLLEPDNPVNNVYSGIKKHFRSCRKDRGEIGLADAISTIKIEEGDKSPINVIYEGGDVRTRIIKRLNVPDDTQYGFFRSAPNQQYNPNNKKFLAKHVSNLNNINISSTLGLLKAMTKAANEVGSYFIQPDEVTNIEKIYRGDNPNKIGGMIETVNKSIPRYYRKLIDQKLQDSHYAHKSKDIHQTLGNSKSPLYNKFIDIAKNKYTLSQLEHIFMAEQQRTKYDYMGVAEKHLNTAVDSFKKFATIHEGESPKPERITGTTVNALQSYAGKYLKNHKDVYDPNAGKDVGGNSL